MITATPEIKAALQAAVEARQACWDASSVLELVMGFDDVPDAVNDQMFDDIATLVDANIDDETVEWFLQRVNEANED